MFGCSDFGLKPARHQNQPVSLPENQQNSQQAYKPARKYTSNKAVRNQACKPT